MNRHHDRKGRFTDRKHAAPGAKAVKVPAKDSKKNGGPDHLLGHAVPKNIARDGAPKVVQAAPPHSGMTHVATAPTGEKAMAKGVSRTQAAALLDNTGLAADVADPVPQGKKLTPLAIYPGMKSRILPTSDDDLNAQAQNVLREGKLAAGKQG